MTGDESKMAPTQSYRYRVHVDMAVSCCSCCCCCCCYCCCCCCCCCYPLVWNPFLTRFGFVFRTFHWSWASRWFFVSWWPSMSDGPLIPRQRRPDLFEISFFYRPGIFRLNFSFFPSFSLSFFRAATGTQRWHHFHVQYLFSISYGVNLQLNPFFFLLLILLILLVW